ncbi:ABC transporter ATP-binding protein [Glutamicibacter protophormiae]|uniref:ABC transporter ATP-binding protein n=1 Tax=Glutamicibacter protophormiae TaxID=37930 RepID=UPI002A83BE89|nr:ABC transporter ATP-binding protein [Glutamicibacter protophormiae]WPR66007.1 ABC transporter ATP-binding protein [Glutamicibacter protophormiae]WPR69505.1 ABC transporter ATP-binding protein [Glutamicibacter protophormiae]
MSETPAIATRALSKTYKDVKALDNVGLSLAPNRIYGLLGRNGAGKTTLMSILTGQNFADHGTAEIFGHTPFEHDPTLARLCFIRESQKYPDDFKVFQAFHAAALFFGNWEEELAQDLIRAFNLPVKRRIKKLSRGQLSAVGVIIGMASRADITFFDEPYLGLDAVARQIFYDRLVEDFAQHPRTIVLSSHLIDEVANLLEHVIVIDQGRIIIGAEAEELQGAAVTVTGGAQKVEEFIAGYPVIHRDALGSLASISIRARLSEEQRDRARAQGLELTPVSLQQLVVRSTLNSQKNQEQTTERQAIK